jgi:hypothetical protein
MFEYINVVEKALEKLYVDSKLNILQSDSDDTVADTICKTLGSIQPIYIRHAVDFSYDIANGSYSAIEKDIIEKFNKNISMIRSERKDGDWR